MFYPIQTRNSQKRNLTGSPMKVLLEIGSRLKLKWKRRESTYYLKTTKFNRTTKYQRRPQLASIATSMKSFTKLPQKAGNARKTLKGIEKNNLTSESSIRFKERGNLLEKFHLIFSLASPSIKLSVRRGNNTLS